MAAVRETRGRAMGERQGRVELSEVGSPGLPGENFLARFQLDICWMMVKKSNSKSENKGKVLNCLPLHMVSQL